MFDEDPYTSQEQRQRDQYKLDNENWNEVVFEEVLGTSTTKMALHSDWVAQKGYDVHKVVHLELPEQGISGAFLITSIKHILPQKRPVDENPDDSYDFSPVTAIFTHQSNQVYEVRFDNGETLGVTYQHPIYSLTYGDWRLAGELEVGEEVLSKEGNAVVISKRKDQEEALVYNFEVKDAHNFLVGDDGIVVHNACNRTLVRDYVEGGANIADLPDGPIKDALTELKLLKSTSNTKFDNFLDDFPDDVPLHLGDGGVRAWEFAFNAPAARINTSTLESISTALGRSLKEMSEVVTLAGHPNITNYTVTHIFRGHGTGGHHHIASLISDNTKKLKGRTNIGGDGFYKADIEVNGTLRSEVGFFPDEWDELKAIDEVKHAWEEALSNPSMPVNGLYYGKTTTGQWIRMTKNNTYNNIQNAFPDFDYTP